MTESKKCRDRYCDSKNFRVIRNDKIVWELKCRKCGTIQLVYKTWLDPQLLELGWKVT